MQKVEEGCLGWAEVSSVFNSVQASWNCVSMQKKSKQMQPVESMRRADLALMCAPFCSCPFFSRRPACAWLRRNGALPEKLPERSPSLASVRCHNTAGARQLRSLPVCCDSSHAAAAAHRLSAVVQQFQQLRFQHLSCSERCCSAFSLFFATFSLPVGVSAAAATQAVVVGCSFLKHCFSCVVLASAMSSSSASPAPSSAAWSMPSSSIHLFFPRSS